jgi:hypothetical protein
VDPLSRRDTKVAAELSVLSAPSFDIYDEVRQEFDDQSSLCALCVAVLTGDRGDKWQVIDGLVLVHGRVYVSPDSPCLPLILFGAHGVGHEGA